MKEGRFKDEILPVKVPSKKGETTLFEIDEGPRESDLQKMAKMKPAFKEDGTVTAANSSKISDGASALVLMSFEKAKAFGLKPMAKVVAQAEAGSGTRRCSRRSDLFHPEGS